MDANLLRTTINASLIERETEVDALLLGLVAREHVLMIGPKGCAKSYACRQVAGAIEGAKFCERLLAPSTPPEVLFGPPNIKALSDGRYEHIGTDTITDSHMTFLDETMRGSDAITDSLLHYLGPERQVLVGTQQVKVPMLCTVGATNSVPDTAHLAAFFDRWLIRIFVRRISPAGRRRLMYETLPEVKPVVALSDMEAAHHTAMALPISEDAQKALDAIIDELFAAGVQASDRRLRQSMKIARAAAFLAGETVESGGVKPHHLEFLGNVLWDEPHEQPEKCAEIVGRISNPIGARLTEMLREVDEIVTGAGDAAERMGAIKKLEACEKEAAKLKVSGNGRADKCLTYIRRERVRMQAAALGIDPAKAEALFGAVK